MKRAFRLLLRGAVAVVVLAAAGRVAFEGANRLWPFPVEMLERLSNKWIFRSSCGFSGFTLKVKVVNHHFLTVER